MKYSEWYRAERKAQKAYRAACKRGEARLNNPDPVSAHLAQCAMACDRAYLAWFAIRGALDNVTEWDTP